MDDIFALKARDDDKCGNLNDYDDGYFGARISAVFVVLVGSGLGSMFPVLSSRYSFIRMPWWCFFIAKYFGSGVIVATGFIHLLEPASDSLGSDCLHGTWQLYPWAFGICLITLFAMFLMELLSFHFVERKLEQDNPNSGHSHSHFGDEVLYTKKDESDNEEAAEGVCPHGSEDPGEENCSDNKIRYPKHFLHAEEHQDPETVGTPADMDFESYATQFISIFILEFGIIFHSVFVGISLSIAGSDEFPTLYVVIVFHQLFEGLGLGCRVATVPWPQSRRFIPWILALTFTFTTPIAIAIGIGVRKSYPPNSQRALITNGIFDAISSGILIYTGIVELIAHEFLYSGEFKGPNKFPKMLFAYFVVCAGAGLMALLGRWA